MYVKKVLIDIKLNKKKKKKKHISSTISLTICPTKKKQHTDGLFLIFGIRSNISAISSKQFCSPIIHKLMFEMPFDSVEKSLNANSFHTSGPISFKLHRNIAKVTFCQIAETDSALVNKLATRAKNRKS